MRFPAGLPAELRIRWQQIRRIQEVGVAAALMAICLVLSLSAASFLQTNNLLQVARQASTYGIMAIGMVFVLAMGEVDLSVGSIVTVVNIVSAGALRAGAALPVALAAGLATGLVCGLLNGVLSVLLRVPTIIITLGTLSVYRGVALVLSHAAPISRFSRTGFFFTVGSGGVLGLPLGVWIMAGVGAMGYLLLNHTPFGWRVQAIGSNRQAARFSGIPVARYRVVVMGLMGLIAAISGLVSLAFFGSADPNTGLGQELSVIAAAIIGGTSLSGGSGSVPGAILGALLMAVVGNGLVMLGLPSYWGMVVTGAVIIAAVAVSTLISSRR